MVEKGGLDLVWSTKVRLWLAAAVIALSAVIAISAVSWAEPHESREFLSLGEALARTAEKHPTVDAAHSARNSKALTAARRSVVYNPRLSTTLKPLSFSVRNQEAKLALGESISINGSLSTIQGWDFSVANRWQGVEKESVGLTVGASLQLWPPSRYEADYLNLLEARESAALAARQEYRACMQAMIDTYRRYRSLQIDRDRLAVHKEAYEADLAAYERVVGKAEQGLASAVEVIVAQQEKAESLAVYQRALRDYERELKSLQADLSLEGELVELEPLPARLDSGSVQITLDQAVALAWEADLTLRERNLALASVRRQVEAKRVDNGVELSVGGKAEFSEEQTWEPAFETYISFSYSLCDGGLKELEKKEAELALDQAEQAVQTQQIEVSLEVESKLSEVQWLEDQMQIASLNHEKVVLQHNARILQAANGLIPQAEAAASKRLLLQAQFDWLEAIVAYEAARLELLMMTGQALNIEGGCPN